MVLAGQHKPQQVVAFPTYDEYRSILALAVVFLVRNPGPNNFSGVGVPIQGGGVEKIDLPPIVAGVVAFFPAGLLATWLSRDLRGCLTGGPKITEVPLLLLLAAGGRLGGLGLFL